jgi:hypothetical protein
MTTNCFISNREAVGLKFAELTEKFSLEVSAGGAGGRTFTVINIADAKADSIAPAKFKELLFLAANNELNGTDNELLENHEFRLLARSIPGAESFRTKLRRAWEKASYLAQGLNGMAPSGKMMDKRYWQEALLPMHPSGAQLEDFFDAWKGSRSTLSFEDWFMQRPARLHPPSLKYLSEPERSAYAVTFEGGRVFQSGRPLVTDAFESDKRSHAAIYVILSDGIMYVGPYLLDRFQHSCFNGGRPVIGAGEIKTTADGTIIELSSKSGHYKPTADQLHDAVEFLQRRGIDLTHVRLEENGEDSITSHPSAKDFFALGSPRSRSMSSPSKHLSSPSPRPSSTTAPSPRPGYTSPSPGPLAF